MIKNLNGRLRDYYQARCFSSREELDKFLKLKHVFSRPKRLYFDEVENANVWSFYLVERDLHHTYEEYILDRGLAPYAVWSRPSVNAIVDNPATFPISETASFYKQPVPKAGDVMLYVTELLHLDSHRAIFGFLGFCCPREGKRSPTPSVAAAWLRMLVEYRGDGRQVIPIPPKLERVLRSSLAPDLSW